MPERGSNLSSLWHRSPRPEQTTHDTVLCSWTTSRHWFIERATTSILLRTLHVSQCKFRSILVAYFSSSCVYTCASLPFSQLCLPDLFLPWPQLELCWVTNCGLLYIIFCKDSRFLLAVSLWIGSKRSHRYFYLQVSHYIYAYIYIYIRCR